VFDCTLNHGDTCYSAVHLKHPLATLTIIGSNKGLFGVRFGKLPLVGLARDASPIQTAVQQILCYLDGKPITQHIQIDLASATPFQKEVWKITQTIPFGETRSYAWVASQLGNPKKARAIGQAMSANPIPIVIPCHRVIASDGSLGGFSAGLKWKQILLDHESRH